MKFDSFNFKYSLPKYEHLLRYLFKFNIYHSSLTNFKIIYQTNAHITIRHLQHKNIIMNCFTLDKCQHKKSIVSIKL
jgi:hypothetical protein